MRKYYYKDAADLQQGPFTLDELIGKNITPETPVWYDTLPKWTTAAEVDELKSIIVSGVPEAETPVVTMPIEEKVEEKVFVAETPIVPTPVVVSPSTVEATAATVTPAAAAPKATTTSNNKKSTAWVSWALSILVLGGAGYYVYQDIEKGKSANTASLDAMEKDMKVDVSNDPAQTDPTITIDNSTSLNDTSTISVISETVTTTEPTTPAPTGSTDADKKAAAKKKLEDDKKKAALAKQKTDEIKKQELAAQAALAKELQYRNNWSKYITVGALNPTPLGDDGINAFDVPVYNGTDGVIDKVTIRIDYYKKEKKDKIVSSETITVYKIPGKSGMVGKAPENKKSRKAVATITGVTSRKLHLCYPQSNGNAADPYYCN